MPSSHLILCHPLLLLPPIPPSIRVFSSESTLCMRWPKYWSFSFNISSSNEHPGLICFILSGVISPLISSSILGAYWPGEFLFQYPIILPSHTVHGVLKARILWSLLQWTTFCQTSPPWPDHLGWPHAAWLSVTELDKTVALWSDWLVFCDYGFSVPALWCPLATPTFLLSFLLPWTWGSLHGCPSKAQPLLLTLDKGYLLMAAPPVLERGVAPLSPPVSQQPLLGGGGAPLGHSPCPRMWGSSGIFIGSTDVEAETPMLWPPDAKNWLIWKDPDAGKDWGQEEKGTTED